MDLMTYLLAIQKIQEVSSDTTYTLTADIQNKTIVLTPSIGTAQVITVPYATDASTVNGKNVPELENGKIPASYLPSYVDDVEEYEDQEHFPSTGESNKIYIDLTTNKIYRWSGTTYVEISESLALGETSSTAFRGDHGKIAYDHSLITSGNPHNVTKTDIGLDNVGNFKAVSTVASQGLTATEQENAKANIGLGAAADKDIDISIEESSQSTNLPTTKAVSDFVQTQTDKVVGTIKSVSNLPAPIASFSGAAALPMPKLEVAIEPQQDLHGYDSPWVGGAGKNKLEVNATSNTVNGVTFTVNSDGTIKANGTATANADLWLHNSYGSTDAFVGVGDYIVNCVGSKSGVQLQIGYAQSVYRIIESESDVSISATNNGISWVLLRVSQGTSVNNTLIKPMIRLASVTDATFAPYSNICPISGWDEVNVGVSGENLIDITSMTPTYALNGITYTINSDGSVIANGTATGRSQVYWSIPQNTAKTLANKKLSGGSSQSGCSLFLELNESPFTNYATDTGEGATISSDIANATTTVNYVFRIAQGTTVNNLTITPRITDEMKTITLDLDGTRYGGKVDLVSGVMTVEKVRASGLNWQEQSSETQKSYYSNVIDNIKLPTSTYTTVGAISSDYIEGGSSSFVSSGDGKFCISQGGRININDNRYQSLADFKVAIPNIDIVYELATPLTIQLTPTVVKSLLVSNVWSDTGNILDAQYISYEYDKICAKYSENIIPTDDFALNTTTGNITTDGDIIRKNGYWGDTYGGTHTSLIDAIDDLYNLIQQNNS